MPVKQEPVKFNIKKFDMRWIGADGDGKIIIFLGKRKTGKSVLVLDYLWHNQDFPLGTVISPTDDLNHTYSPHIPSIFIHSKFSEKLISDFLIRQRKIVARQNRITGLPHFPHWFIDSLRSYLCRLAGIFSPPSR